MTDYLNPIPINNQSNKPVEVKINEYNAPKRIITKYKTTGDFQDISKESEGITK